MRTPALRACAANPTAIAATDCDRQEVFHQFGIAHSNWFRCRRSECAESSRRTSGMVLHSVREPPSPCETQSPFPESPAFASVRSRSIHSFSVLRVAANSLSHSSGCNLCVSAMGDSWAACRISSEYALPMPLTMRGSVRALLSVRFSTVSASRNELRSLAKTSIPPGSTERKSSSPARTDKDARCFVPASVSTREPVGKSKAARLLRPASFA